MSVFDKFFYSLLICIPVAIYVWYAAFSAPIVFSLAALAIVPLAKLLGEATEELSVHTNAAMGGLLNATFGNATEFIIGIVAIQAGLIDIVKASIVGSIISNLLLVLGMAMFFGGLKTVQQKFNATAAKTAGSTLLLTVTALVVPAFFLQAPAHMAPLSDEYLSVIVSVLLIAAYGAGLLFTLKTHAHLYVQEVGKYEAQWSITFSCFVLAIVAVAIAFMSEILVGAIEPLIAQFGWSATFIGVIVLAIIGNAAEHASAVMVAMKNKMDLALQVAIGSATQISMLVAPLLVLISLAFPHHLNLIFDGFELAALVLSVLVVNAIVEDGESNWLEGMQLLVAYAIIAAAFFFHD